MTQPNLELQADQLHLDPWEHNGAAHPGNHFQAHEKQENHQVYSACVHQGEVMLD